MTVMPKSPPRYLNKPYTDFFFKWTSRLNTFMYRRGGGEGFGGREKYWRQLVDMYPSAAL